MNVNELEESMLTLIRLLSDGNAAWRKKVADLESNLSAAMNSINNATEKFGLSGEGSFTDQLNSRFLDASAYESHLSKKLEAVRNQLRLVDARFMGEYAKVHARDKRIAELEAEVESLKSNLTAATNSINNATEKFGLSGEGSFTDQLSAYIEEKTGGRDKLFERAVKDSLQLAKVLAEEEDKLFKRAVKDRLRPVRFEELNPGKRYWRAFNRGKQARWECVELLEVEDTNSLLVRTDNGFAGTLWVDMGSLYVTE